MTVMYRKPNSARQLQILVALSGLSMLTGLSAHGSEMGESTSHDDVGKTTFFMAEKPGPHPIGLKVVEQYDYSRAFQPLVDDLGKPYRGETARPIQTLIWYPAQGTSSKPMTVGEYIDLSTTETSFGSPKWPAGPGEWWFDGWKSTRSDSMWAVRDAPPAPGRFPIVIYAPSFTSWSWENADLCEYIASYGYVVISSPGMGVRRESTHDVAGASAHAQDISFLIGYAHTLADADTSEVAVVGFSWGGLSNLFAASHDNRIKALVALDGSMRYFPGLVRQADVAPEKLTLPLLFFKGQTSIEDQAQHEATFNSAGPSVLNAWVHGDLIAVEMLGFFHPEFLSMSQRNEGLWQLDFPRWQEEADYGRKDGVTGYAWVTRYTREFLDAYLKHDVQALTYLKNKPSENGVPPHVMAVKFRGAVPMPASFDSFKVEVGRQGFDRAAQVYASIRKQNSEFKLDTSDLSSWGYALLIAGHLPEAIEIMKLNVQLFPSGDAFSGLGEAYMRSGEKKAAIESYKKALKKAPDNVVFKSRLNKLEGTRSP
jgi:tetratricopeptide (TPR) repeat protein